MSFISQNEGTITDTPPKKSRTGLIIIIIVIVIVVIVAAILIYFFLIRGSGSNNGGGGGGGGGGGSVDCTVAPAKPTGFSITNPEVKSLTLTWNSATDTDFYDLYISPTTPVAQVSSNLFYSDTGTSVDIEFDGDNTEYYLLVARNQCGTTPSDQLTYTYCQIDDPEPITNNTWFSYNGLSNVSATSYTATWDVTGIPDEQRPVTVSVGDIEMWDAFSILFFDCTQSIGSTGLTVNVGDNEMAITVNHTDELMPTITGSCTPTNAASIPPCSSTLAWVGVLRNVTIENQCGAQSSVEDFALGNVCDIP